MYETVRQTDKTQLVYVRDYYNNLLASKWLILDAIDARKDSLQAIGEMILSMARLPAEMKRIDAVRHSLGGFK